MSQWQTNWAGLAMASLVFVMLLYFGLSIVNHLAQRHRKRLDDVKYASHMHRAIVPWLMFVSGSPASSSKCNLLEFDFSTLMPNHHNTSRRLVPPSSLHRTSNTTGRTGMGKGVVAEPTGDAMALFEGGNPSELFSEMHLIGHGNFGSVYQVPPHATRTCATHTHGRLPPQTVAPSPSS